MDEQRMTTIFLQYGVQFKTQDAYDNIKQALENNKPFVYFVDEFGNNCIVRCADIIAVFQMIPKSTDNNQATNS